MHPDILYRVRLLGGPQAFNLIRRVRSPYAIPICRSSSLGGQRIVYPTKEGSIPFYGAKYMHRWQRGPMQLIANQ